MTDQTIFNDDQSVNTNVPPVVQPATPTIPQELVEFVGEGKKYASVEAALKSVPHAQSHIQKLEQELAQSKAELEKRKAAEELLEDIKKGITQPGDTPPKVDLSQDVVSEIVKKVIQKEKVEEIALSNQQSVVSSFTQAFGENAEAKFVEIAKENGLSIEQFNQLAATSPEAVLKLAGLKKQTQPVGYSTGSINTQAINQPKQPETASIRVKPGASTKDVMAAWQAAGEKVLNQYKG